MSEQLGNAISESSDPDPIDCDCERIATGGQAVRNASTAFATMIGRSPFQPPPIQRAMTFAKPRRENTFPTSSHAASSIKLAALKNSSGDDLAVGLSWVCDR